MYAVEFISGRPADAPSYFALVAPQAYTVGRDTATNTLPLCCPTVSRTHATIRCLPRGAVSRRTEEAGRPADGYPPIVLAVTNHSPHGVTVNGVEAFELEQTSFIAGVGILRIGSVIMRCTYRPVLVALDPTMDGALVQELAYTYARLGAEVLEAPQPTDRATWAAVRAARDAIAADDDIASLVAPAPLRCTVATPRPADPVATFFVAECVSGLPSSLLALALNYLVVPPAFVGAFFSRLASQPAEPLRDTAHLLAAHAVPTLHADFPGATGSYRQPVPRTVPFPLFPAVAAGGWAARRTNLFANHTFSFASPSAVEQFWECVVACGGDIAAWTEALSLAEAMKIPVDAASAAASQVAPGSAVVAASASLGGVEIMVTSPEGGIEKPEGLANSTTSDARAPPQSDDPPIYDSDVDSVTGVPLRPGVAVSPNEIAQLSEKRNNFSPRRGAVAGGAAPTTTGALAVSAGAAGMQAASTTVSRGGVVGLAASQSAAAAADGAAAAAAATGSGSGTRRQIAILNAEEAEVLLAELNLPEVPDNDPMMAELMADTTGNGIVPTTEAALRYATQVRALLHGGGGADAIGVPVAPPSVAEILEGQRAAAFRAEIHQLARAGWLIVHVDALRNALLTCDADLIPFVLIEPGALTAGDEPDDPTIADADPALPLPSELQKQHVHNSPGGRDRSQPRLTVHALAAVPRAALPGQRGASAASGSSGRTPSDIDEVAAFNPTAVVVPKAVGNVSVVSTSTANAAIDTDAILQLPAFFATMVGRLRRSYDREINSARPRLSRLLLQLRRASRHGATTLAGPVSTAAIISEAEAMGTQPCELEGSGVLVPSATADSLVRLIDDCDMFAETVAAALRGAMPSASLASTAPGNSQRSHHRRTDAEDAMPDSGSTPAIVREMLDPLTRGTAELRAMADEALTLAGYAAPPPLDLKDAAPPHSSVPRRVLDPVYQWDTAERMPALDPGVASLAVHRSRATSVASGAAPLSAAATHGAHAEFQVRQSTLFARFSPAAPIAGRRGGAPAHPSHPPRAAPRLVMQAASLPSARPTIRTTTVGAPAASGAAAGAPPVRAADLGAVAAYRRLLLDTHGLKEGAVRFELWLQGQPPEWVRAFGNALERRSLTFTDWIRMGDPVPIVSTAGHRISVK